MKTNNGFGDQTYWNRPAQGRSRKLPTKYPSIKAKTKAARVKTPSRSPSPTPSQTPSHTPCHISNASTIVSPSRSARKQHQMSPEEENDDKDEIMKSTLPTFSNETDWEMAIFELGLVLDRIWPHKHEMDIMEYMTPHNPAVVTWNLGQIDSSILRLQPQQKKVLTQKCKYSLLVIRMQCPVS